MKAWISEVGLLVLGGNACDEPEYGVSGRKGHFALSRLYDYEAIAISLLKDFTFTSSHRIEMIYISIICLTGITTVPC